ncbi:hypothetical protein [Flavobacterium suncheonense]|uniref:Uncharacterized protein n=1 Tax=Flavobacterium suncheonense GH29-5 = DSM 17707 TaxID=1121899 RepID=A0A0A2MB39_9FLAO|nr:hypothetical protein [Flavobacterium suncheonense]KGO89897.1 hypothetical protein Q764_04615 [Flavobacterium suncheonense GH29-5 = DSM 17707]
MAKQKGILPLSGTLEGINFYYRKGVPVARKAGGGFTGKAIKNKPSMVRIRENNTEFGDCAKVKKQLRLALYPFLKDYKETTLHGRLMRMLQEVKNCDPVSERGQRKVGLGLQTPEGQKLFQDFAFTAPHSAADLLGGVLAYDSATFTLTVSDWTVQTVAFPAGATHVEILFGVLDFDFDRLTASLQLSAPLVLAKTTTATFFTLSPETAPELSGTPIAFVGVRFYEEVNGRLFGLKGVAGIGLDCLWVG